MKTRPLAVTLIGWLFVVAGAVGTVYHATEIDLNRPFDDDAAWVIAVRLLAIAGGVFLLRGRSFARWLLVVWMGFHVVLGALHSVQQGVVHGLLLAGIAFLLFRPEASRFFRGE